MLVGWVSIGIFLSVSVVCMIFMFSCAFELLKDRQEMTVFNVILSPCFKKYSLVPLAIMKTGSDFQWANRCCFIYRQVATSSAC